MLHDPFPKMSKNTLLNYFTRSPIVSKKENDASTLNKSNNCVSSSVTPKRKKVAGNSSFTKSENVCSPVAIKKKIVNSPDTDEDANKSISSAKKSRKSLKIFSTPKSGEKSKIEEADNVQNIDKSECDDYGSPPLKKRKRIIMELESDEDSEDEYVPEKEAESSEECESDEPSSEDESSVAAESEDQSPEKKPKKKRNTLAKPPINARATDKPKLPSSAVVKDLSEESDSWPHLKLPFLQADKIRDSNRRLKGDTNYDAKTLYVPEDYKNKLTPAVRQWWELKSQNFDVVLFFKVGKFYELYHMDAVIAANELNLTFMRGEFAHVGFPEIAYGRFSATLIEKGYKVARVEQTETPEMMNERCKHLAKCTKFDKVVRREICQITSRGTRVFGILDGETKEAESNFLLAIAEKEMDSVRSRYGVCFVDTSIGLFHVGQFDDDRHASRLRTMIAHYTPVQILSERGQITGKTHSLFNTVLSAAVKDALMPEKEFWSSSKTLITLAENYYPNKNFPKPLLKFLGEDCLVNMTSKDENELGIRALGAVVWCLQRSLIDHQLLTMGRFTIYEPIDSKTLLPSSVADAANDFKNGHMVLDAITLKNLNILENADGNVRGTLLHKLDKCCTSFGKRLLLRWICSPLGNVKSIKARQDAVKFLIDCDLIKDIRCVLSQLPDLERLFSRIHAQGTNGIKESHPDTRAFLFEEKTYSKRKIIDFISTLNGFKIANKIVDLFETLTLGDMPYLIQQCCTLASKTENGSFPDLCQHLEFFQNSFDHQEAQKEGRILPSPGTDSQYDEAMETLKAIEKEIAQHLKEQCAHFGCKITYFGNDKKRYQLEVPESAARKANSDYELQSQRKGFKRYTTEKTKSFLERMTAAEEQKINVLKHLRERIFSKFSEKFSDWNAAIQCLAVLDVLTSFAEYSKNEDVTCVPKFIRISDDENPFVFVNDGRYPCSTGDDVFIPNSTYVGGNTSDEYHPQLVLVTGPNMGGKSTLMRQLGLIVIMAHMGCYVPAVSLKLGLVDRIFTRLGANDDIMAGESTFYVELCETSSILQHATKHSLVLIDELGRGTSTYDGTAIASAVLKELSRIKCRTLFSTHYHSLVENFKLDSNIALGHMACMVENEYEDEENNSEETVTFLYKFAEGACPKSYGFNASRLAGMPRHITKVGQQRAKQLEIDVSKRNNFKKLFQLKPSNVRELIAVL